MLAVRALVLLQSKEFALCERELQASLSLHFVAPLLQRSAAFWIVSSTAALAQNQPERAVAYLSKAKDYNAEVAHHHCRRRSGLDPFRCTAIERHCRSTQDPLPAIRRRRARARATSRRQPSAAGDS